MRLNVWCVLSNAAVIIALFRSVIRSIRPGLLLLCSFSFTDLLWGATVVSVDSGFRIKHLMNSQVCEVYGEMMAIPLFAPTVMSLVGTFAHLFIISIDRYLAVKCFVQYKLLVTRCRALLACSVVWVISVTIGTLRQVGVVQSQSLSFLAFGFVILTAAVIIALQIMTFRLLHHHNNTFAEQMAEVNHPNPINSAGAASECQLTRDKQFMLRGC